MTLEPAELGDVFRKNLRDWRKRSDMTQAELADKAGLPQPNISALEHGKYYPSFETIARLATALKIPANWLLDANATESAKITS